MITLREIIAVRGVLGKMQLSQLSSAQRNDIRFAISDLESQTKIVGELEQTIIADHGLKVANDNRIDTSKLSAEQQAKFASEMDDLHNRQIELKHTLSAELCDMLISATPSATCNDMMLLDKLRQADSPATQPIEQ